MHSFLLASSSLLLKLGWPGPGPRDYGLVEGFLPFLPLLSPGDYSYQLKVAPLSTFITESLDILGWHPLSA